MSCETIGAYGGSPNAFVDYVIAADPSGACQGVKVGKNSPCPVGDDEVLGRFVFSPTHLPHGMVDESLVADLARNGLSITRTRPEWSEACAELHPKGEQQAQRIRAGENNRPAQPDRRYVGLVQLRTAEVRALAVDDARGRLRVYDTSLPDEPLHGDVIPDFTALSKVLRKELRVRLFLLAQRAGLYLSPAAGPELTAERLGLEVHRT